MMTRRVRLGVIGCGEASQILHLPALRELGGLFEVTALCDVSRVTLDAVGAEWPGAKLCQDSAALIRDGAAEAVLIASPHAFHADAAAAAMLAGKHVFIEKPMCVTLAEADRLLEAEQAAGVIAQVGYMRRYAPAFLEAVQLVQKQRGSIRLARVHCVIGRNALFTAGTSKVIKGADVPQTVIDEGKALLAAKTTEAIGASSGIRANAYAMLLGLSSHDLSAMRELIGVPKRVLYCALRHDGRAITAAFDYGDFICQFETAVDGIGRFDAHLEVYGMNDVIRVEYTTPYIRHQAAELIVTSAKPPAGFAVTRSAASRIDCFVQEWRAFHDNIVCRKTPKTSIADARQDLVLFREMMQAAV